MSRDWINIRIGTRHLIIGSQGVSFKKNNWHVKHKPEKWFQCYNWFGRGIS